jgi:hypothetical protein
LGRCALTASGVGNGEWGKTGWRLESWAEKMPYGCLHYPCNGRGVVVLCAAFLEESAGIAQLVEQLICNQQVVGSSPTAGSLSQRDLWKVIKISVRQKPKKYS